MDSVRLDAIERSSTDRSRATEHADGARAPSADEVLRSVRLPDTQLHPPCPMYECLERRLSGQYWRQAGILPFAENWPFGFPRGQHEAALSAIARGLGRDAGAYRSRLLQQQEHLLNALANKRATEQDRLARRLKRLGSG